MDQYNKTVGDLLGKVCTYSDDYQVWEVSFFLQILNRKAQTVTTCLLRPQGTVRSFWGNTIENPNDKYSLEVGIKTSHKRAVENLFNFLMYEPFHVLEKEEWVDMERTYELRKLIANGTLKKKDFIDFYRRKLWKQVLNGTDNGV